MHLDHDHIAGGHTHTHEHTHADGTTHTHAHSHEHAQEQEHTHSHACNQECGSCNQECAHTPMEELIALMKYMAGHNAAHTRELAQLAQQLEQAGSHAAYEQVMAAVSDFEKGNLRLSAVLASLSEP